MNSRKLLLLFKNVSYVTNSMTKLTKKNSLTFYVFDDIVRLLIILFYKHMKNVLFTIIALVSFSTMSSASTITKELKKKEVTVTSKKTEDAFATRCCTRRGKTLNGQSVAITACVESTGDMAIDMGNACGKAAAIVAATIKVLDAMPN
jgi:hypothetical protein